MMESTELLLKLATRNVIRNKRRSFLTFMAITVGLWSAATLASVARGVSGQLARDAIKNLTGHVQIHAKGYLDDPAVTNSIGSIDEPFLEKLSSLSPVGISIRVRTPGVVRSERESAGVTIVGIDPEVEKKNTFLGDVELVGRLNASVEDDGVVIGKKMAEILQVGLGKRIVLLAQDLAGGVADRGFRIVGIFDAELESTERSFVFVGRNIAQRMLGMGDAVSEISLVFNEDSSLKSIVDRLQRIFPDLDIKLWTDIEPFAMAIREVQGGFLRFWFFIVVMAIGFGLVNTLVMSVFERTREFSMFQALGMTQMQIRAQMVLECMTLLLAGGIAGNFFTALSIKWLESGIDISKFAQGAQRFGIGRVIYPQIVWSDHITINVMVFIMGLLGSLYPAYKASCYNPVEGLRRV